MSLSQPVKNWQRLQGRIAGSGSYLTDQKNVLLAWVNSWTGFSQNAWQCRGSWSAGTSTGAMDNVNRWASISDIAWNPPNGGSPIADITIAQPQMPTTLSGGPHMLIDATTSGSGQDRGLRCSVSLVNGIGSNFGGSNVSPPTATDQQSMMVNAAATDVFWHGQTSSIGPIWWVALMTDDGTCSRFMAGVANTANGERGTDRCILFVSVETLTDVEPGTQWAYNFAMQSGGTSTAGTWGSVNIAKFSDSISVPASGASGVCRPLGTVRTSRWSVPSSGSGNNAMVSVTRKQGVNVYDKKVRPRYIDVMVPSGAIGYVGRIQDMYAWPEGQPIPAEAQPYWDLGPDGILLPTGISGTGAGRRFPRY